MTKINQFDVAVIGAGIAGLTCARKLQQAGYNVVVLEKSRGVGGRMATRRLYGTLADHGTCYLDPKQELFRKFADHLLTTGVLHEWTDSIYVLESDGRLHKPAPEDRYPRYAPPQGMTAIAKVLATGLNLRLSRRALKLTLADAQRWQVTAERVEPDAIGQLETICSRSVVVAVPAPQAVILLHSLTESVLPPEFMAQVEAVRFVPCFSAIAGYPARHYQDFFIQLLDLRAITISNDSDLAWIGLDSSKRATPVQPVFVIQSTYGFAERYLEVADLNSVGAMLLKKAAGFLAPWLATPEWLQVHRWRYAFPQTPLADLYLPAATPAPLVCAGDWCGGARVETAFLSGGNAADYLNRELDDRAMPTTPFWQFQ